MIITGNPLLVGASGKLKGLVVKQYQDKTVLSAIPDMSHRKLSQKQLAANERMQEAIFSAQHITKNPIQKQRACERLQVPPNKVFRALVKLFLLNDDYDKVLGETEQEKRDKLTLATLKTTITSKLPDAEIWLFGNRAKGAISAQNDWDLLILTGKNYPQTRKWELQEKLFAITIPQGTRVNMLLAQKDKWNSDKEYEVLRKRIEQELVIV